MCKCCHDKPEQGLTDQEIEEFRNYVCVIAQVPRRILFGEEADNAEVKRDE